MDLYEIKAFIDAMATSDLAEMEVSKDGWTLRLARWKASTPLARSAPAPMTKARAKPDDGVAPPVTTLVEPTGDVRAPLAGIVYLCPSPGEPPFVAAGQAVERDATVCVIEAMKMFNEVRAKCGGTVESVLVTSGTEVEAGQLLMRIA